MASFSSHAVTDTAVCLDLARLKPMPLKPVTFIPRVGQSPCARDKINIPYYSGQGYTRCGSSRILAALVLKFAGAQLLY